jgi:diguanylate cyclase (GGDEF)-like protein
MVDHSRSTVLATAWPRLLRQTGAALSRVGSRWRIPEIHDGQASAFRAKQLHALLRLTPHMMLANCVNAALICALFWHRVPRWALLCWASALAFVVLMQIAGWWRHGRGAPRARASRKVMRLAAWHAAVLALLYALVPMYLFPRIDEEARLLVATFTASMICAGAFALFTVPQSAIAWVTIVSLGGIYTLLVAGKPLYLYVAVLLVVYAAVIVSTVLSMARIFLARLQAEAEKDRQKQVVDLLLHDFEAHASDWLWEADIAGRLRHVSVRLAEALQQPAAALQDADFTGLIAAHAAGDAQQQRQALAHLRQRLRQPQPFRDVVVLVTLRGEQRWWALTAKPLLDEAGAHHGWRGVGSDITTARRHELELTRLANFDSLTGLANRHHFRARLDATYARSHKPQCALLLLDLDNFKAVNDTLGHGVGDQLLQIVALRLQTLVRAEDLLARLGGDEFVLLCTAGVAPAHLLERARSMLEALREPCIIDGMRIEVRASVGVAFGAEHGASAEDLLKSADMALYAAKDAGRDAVRIFDNAMQARASSRLGVLNDLGRALERGQMFLHYQPQIDLSSGRVSAFETLLRWQHPQRGLVAPSEFISVAEETGLIVPIGAWVLRNACQEALSWPADVNVSVNLSAVQCASRSTVDVVREVLASTGFAPGRLELEVTESSLIADSSTARETLLALKRMGVRIALDDFGTGYSSLAHLRNFSLDKLKIDRSFVAALDRDSDAQAHAIVRSIVHLGQGLKLQIVAEGVETQAQLATLRALGCTGVQGFLLAKPLPPAEVSVFLRERWGEDADGQYAPRQRSKLGTL